MSEQPQENRGEEDDTNVAMVHTEHRIEITEKLIKALEDDRDYYKDVVITRDRQLQQLKGELANMKEAMEAIPIVRVEQRNVILESELKSKEEEIKRLTDRLQIVLSKDGTSTGKINVLTEANKMLEKQRILNVSKIQEQADTIGYRDKEIAELKHKLQMAEDALSRERAKIEKMQVSYKMMKDEHNEMTKQTSIIKGALEKANNEIESHKTRINELLQYEAMFGEKETEVRHLIANILPNKERTISALNVKVTELGDILESVTKETIPRSEHLNILHTEEVRTRKNLRETFREEYQTSVTSLEAANEELERKLHHVEGDLRAMEDKRADLITATDSYKLLVNENTKLNDTVKDQLQNISTLTRELVSAKDRLAKLERREINRMNNINNASMFSEDDSYGGPAC